MSSTSKHFYDLEIMISPVAMASLQTQFVVGNREQFGFLHGEIVISKESYSCDERTVANIFYITSVMPVYDAVTFQSELLKWNGKTVSSFFRKYYSLKSFRNQQILGWYSQGEPETLLKGKEYNIHLKLMRQVNILRKEMLNVSHLIASHAFLAAVASVNKNRYARDCAVGFQAFDEKNELRMQEVKVLVVDHSFKPRLEPDSCLINWENIFDYMGKEIKSEQVRDKFRSCIGTAFTHPEPKCFNEHAEFVDRCFYLTYSAFKPNCTEPVKPRNIKLESQLFDYSTYKADPQAYRFALGVIDHANRNLNVYEVLKHLKPVYEVKEWSPQTQIGESSSQEATYVNTITDGSIANSPEAPPQTRDSGETTIQRPTEGVESTASENGSSQTKRRNRKKDKKSTSAPAVTNSETTHTSGYAVCNIPATNIAAIKMPTQSDDNWIEMAGQQQRTPEKIPSAPANVPKSQPGVCKDSPYGRITETQPSSSPSPASPQQRTPQKDSYPLTNVPKSQLLVYNISPPKRTTDTPPTGDQIVSNPTYGIAAMPEELLLADDSSDCGCFSEYETIDDTDDDDDPTSVSGEKGLREQQMAAVPLVIESSRGGIDATNQPPPLPPRKHSGKGTSCKKVLLQKIARITIGDNIRRMLTRTTTNTYSVADAATSDLRTSVVTTTAGSFSQTLDESVSSSPRDAGDYDGIIRAPTSTVRIISERLKEQYQEGKYSKLPGAESLSSEFENQFVIESGEKSDSQSIYPLTTSDKVEDSTKVETASIQARKRKHSAYDYFTTTSIQPTSKESKPSTNVKSSLSKNTFKNFMSAISSGRDKKAATRRGESLNKKTNVSPEQPHDSVKTPIDDPAAQIDRIVEMLMLEVGQFEPKASGSRFGNQRAEHPNETIFPEPDDICKQSSVASFAIKSAKSQDRVAASLPASADSHNDSINNEVEAETKSIASPDKRIAQDSKQARDTIQAKLKTNESRSSDATNKTNVLKSDNISSVEATTSKTSPAFPHEGQPPSMPPESSHQTNLHQNTQNMPSSSVSTFNLRPKQFSKNVGIIIPPRCSSSTKGPLTPNQLWSWLVTPLPRNVFIELANLRFFLNATFNVSDNEETTLPRPENGSSSSECTATGPILDLEDIIENISKGKCCHISHRQSTTFRSASNNFSSVSNSSTSHSNAPAPTSNLFTFTSNGSASAFNSHCKGTDYPPNAPVPPSLLPRLNRKHARHPNRPPFCTLNPSFTRRSSFIQYSQDVKPSLEPIPEIRRTISIEYETTTTYSSGVDDESNFSTYDDEIIPLCQVGAPLATNNLLSKEIITPLYDESPTNSFDSSEEIIWC